MLELRGRAAGGEQLGAMLIDVALLGVQGRGMHLIRAGNLRQIFTGQDLSDCLPLHLGSKAARLFFSGSHDCSITSFLVEVNSRLQRELEVVLNCGVRTLFNERRTRFENNPVADRQLTNNCSCFLEAAVQRYLEVALSGIE